MEILHQRRQQLLEVARPLPGSIPYLNRRPLNVPARYDGYALIDCLCAWHPHVDRASWLQKIDQSEVIAAVSDGEHSSETTRRANPQQRVRSGERFVHLLPNTTEPDVDADVRFLFEDDECVVVQKPAPLPMHPSGRFNRNTLLKLLAEVYAPERLYAVHRLDADTTGVVLLSRNRRGAHSIQTQFAERSVGKQYLARVYGHPPTPSFRCSAPISEQPGFQGVRTIDEGGLPADTEFAVERQLPDGTSLLRVTPLTGRTNQIRLHLWHLGWPIVNDPVWQRSGAVRPHRCLGIVEPRLCLHAESLSVTDLRGRQRQFTAAAPDWWQMTSPVSTTGRDGLP